MVDITDTLGLWERSLIAWPDGRQDTTTFVAWLQGPSLFADLRQPANPPSFDGVSCLDDLQPQHLDWLVQQEGFAGRFLRDGDAFEWRRIIDFQCPSDVADAGYLAFSDGILVERGRDIPYIRTWHHMHEYSHATYDLRSWMSELQDFHVRAERICWPIPHDVLSRSVALPPRRFSRALGRCREMLGSAVCATRMLDRPIEPSLSVSNTASRTPSFSIDRETIEIKDITAAGKPYVRHWKIVDVDARQLAAEGKL